VVDAAIVWRDVVGVEKDAFLYYSIVSVYSSRALVCVHRLKLVTGVDTSTRPPRRSGKAGKTVESSSRTAAAAPNRSNSSDMIGANVIEALAP